MLIVNWLKLDEAKARIVTESNFDRRLNLYIS